MKTVTLFSHQERGVDKGLMILSKLRGLGIFFDPGLGKTLTIMTIAEKLMQEGEITNVIVVCPKTLYGTWQDQIQEHSDFSRAFEYYGSKVTGKTYNNKLDSATNSVILTNYEAYRNPKKELLALIGRLQASSLIVLDESTSIKGPTSQQTKGVKKVFAKAWGRVIMTGTELTKSPLDLWAQFEFLRPGLWGERSFFKFKEHYAITKPLYLPGGKQTTTVVGFQHLNRIQEIVAPWIIRAKKEDCMDLPPKIFQNIPVELSAKEWRVYQELKKRLISILDSGEVISVDQKIALFMRFRTITGGWADTTNPICDDKPSKLLVLEDMVSDDDRQAIIWCSFTHEIQMMEKELAKHGKCVTYYGAVSQEDRIRNQQRFLDGSARFFIANPSTAALGLNLQHCGLQYFYSLPTRCGDYLQSLDRSHRIGTKTEVVYRFLLGDFGGKHSVDWRIKALLDQSSDLLHAFQTREISELISLV